MTRGVMYFGRLHFLQKTLRFNSSFYCPPIRTCSDLSKRFCFDEMVTQRRAEAQRSLVVQISSKASYEELYGYCSRFAKIRGVHHYKNTSEEQLDVSFRLLSRQLLSALHTFELAIIKLMADF